VAVPPGIPARRVPEELSWDGLLEEIFEADQVIAWGLGGGLRPPSGGRRAPDGALLPASPQTRIAAAKPPLEATGRYRRDLAHPLV